MIKQQEMSLIKRINPNPNSKVELREKGNQQSDYILEGYAIVFNQRTSIGNYFYEEIDPHALDNADLSTVFLYSNHQANQIPMAAYRSDDIDRTMELVIDDKGLRFMANLDVENNTFSASTYSAVSRGDVKDMSFAFCVEVESDEWFDIEAPMPIRRITKIARVHEISVVNEGAYPTTEVYARSKKNISPIDTLARAKIQNNFPLLKAKFKFKEERKKWKL